jgi:hypothetical protein
VRDDAGERVAERTCPFSPQLLALASDAEKASALATTSTNPAESSSPVSTNWSEICWAADSRSWSVWAASPVSAVRTAKKFAVRLVRVPPAPATAAWTGWTKFPLTWPQVAAVMVNGTSLRSPAPSERSTGTVSPFTVAVPEKEADCGSINGASLVPAIRPSNDAVSVALPAGDLRRTLTTRGERAGDRAAVHLGLERRVLERALSRRPAAERACRAVHHRAVPRAVGEPERVRFGSAPDRRGRPDHDRSRDHDREHPAAPATADQLSLVTARFAIAVRAGSP